jgi:hypothetical protein
LAARRLGDFLIFLIMAGATVIPIFLSVPSGSLEELRLFGLKMPAACFSKTWLNIECLTCGLTRSFTLVTHGRFSEAFSLHALGPILYLMMLAEAGFRLVLLKAGHGLVSPSFRKVHAMLWGILLAGMVVAWLIKLTLR